MVQRLRLALLAMLLGLLAILYRTPGSSSAPLASLSPHGAGEPNSHDAAEAQVGSSRSSEALDVPSFLHPFVTVDNSRYLERYRARSHVRLALVVAVGCDETGGPRLLTTADAHHSPSRLLLLFNQSAIAVIDNETYVAAPEWVVLADSPSKQLVFLRVTEHAKMDRDALLCVPHSFVQQLAQRVKRKKLMQQPISDLEQDLPAQFPADHDCGLSPTLTPPSGAYTAPRLAIHAVLFWKSHSTIYKKMPYMHRMLRNAAEYGMQVDVFVHCNRLPPEAVSPGREGNDTMAVEAILLRELTRVSLPNSMRVVIVPHELHEHPYFLTWKPRALIRNQRLLYDLVINTEDDMHITRVNLLDYYCRYKRLAADSGFNLGFLRYEVGVVGGKGGKAQRKILSDVLRGQVVGRAKDVLTLGEQPFVRVRIQVYFAFWIADRRDVLEMVEHPGFMISDTSSNKYPLIREDASCLKGPMMLPRYNYTHIMPANLQTMMIHDMCQVWHMSNSYVSKGMARYDAAARIA